MVDGYGCKSGLYRLAIHETINMSSEKNPVVKFLDWIGFKAAVLFGGTSKEGDLFIGVFAILITVIGFAFAIAALLSFITGISILWFFGAAFFGYMVCVLWTYIRRSFGV